MMTDRERDRIESAIRHIQTAVDVDPWAVEIAVEAMKEKISREPSEDTSCSEIPNSSDSISRQAAIDAANKLVDRFEQVLRDIRETNGDESVCGLCEYDGAFIGQSGDWVNECPGFDKEDCFELSDECRKKWLKSVDLPSAQPEVLAHGEGVLSAQPEPCDDPRADIYYLAEKIGIHRLYALVVKLRGEPEPCEDAVSRQVAIDALNEQIKQCDKALSSFDISMKDEYAVKVERASLVAYKEQLEFLPSAQPDTSRIENILHGKSPEEQYDFLHWLMCTYAMQFTDSREAVIAWLGGAEGDEG